jgi:pimeloyl-ACP methyl ester carboxylesterase
VIHVTLSDGRRLSAHDSTNGDPRAFTIVWHHGSPQTGAALEPHLAAAGARHIRWISYGRPGYGGSTAQPGRTIEDAAGDVRQLLDALGVDRFATMGASGGGPHALACALAMPDRVSGAATFATLAPYSKDFDWFSGMSGDGPALRAALRGENARVEFERTSAFDAESFTAGDYAALDARWASLGADVGQAAAGGTGGLVADDLALVAPWGAGLAELTVPVLLAHGGADRVVPVSHARRLLQVVPDAELWLRPNDGHISILDTSSLAIDWLRERA